MNKKTVYLILASTLSGMGLQAGINAVGIDTVPSAAAGQKVPTTLLLDAEGQSCAEGIVNRLACPNVNAKLGLTGKNVCKAVSDSWVISVSAVIGEDGVTRSYYASSNVTKAGSWQPGDPQ